MAMSLNLAQIVPCARMATQAASHVVLCMHLKRSRRRFAYGSHPQTEEMQSTPQRTYAKHYSCQTSSSVQDTVSSNNNRHAVHLLAPTEKALGRLAALLMQKGGLQAGDVYCLQGDVGAGKSVFSRAFIRTAAGDPSLTVPSPTYLLQNLYDEATLVHSPIPIHHFDLYRLPSGSPPTLERLNLQASFSSAVSLVEWADRAQACMPAQHLAVHIAALPPGMEEMYSSPPQLSSTQTQAIEGHYQAQGEEGRSIQLARDEVVGSNEETVGTEEEGGGVTEDEDGLESSDDEEDADPYSDQRWRSVRLEACGAGWEQRLSAVVQCIREEELERGNGGTATRLRLLC